MRVRIALLLAGAAVGCSSPTHVDLLSKQDTIKYLIDKEAPPDQWTAPSFNDAAWLKALGAISLTPDGAGVMPAVLARSLFDLGPRASSYQSLSLSLDVPGGFSAYVNGTPMINAANGKSATLNLPAGLVHEAENTLAIDVHPPVSCKALMLAPLLEGKLDPAANNKPNIVRGPYLIAPRTDGISIEWETSMPIASKAVVDGRALDGGSGTHHSVRVDGLLPSHSYPYHVEIDGQKSSDGELVTAPAKGGERVKFIVYGDNRTDGDAHRLVAQGIDAENPDFLINTGDLVDSSSPAEWQTFFDIEYDLLLHVPVYPTLGNHEANSGGSGRFAELFPLGDPKVFGGRVYSADFGDVHISVLDSNSDMGSQARWLDQDLWTAEQHGAKHEFVIMHQGPYSGGQMLMHGSNDDAREHIAPVARAHKVDALFAGHDHFYERGADGDLRYFVTGGGGAPLHSTGSISQTQVARSSHHYLVVDLQGSTVSYTAKSPTGAILDQLSVTK